MTSEEVADFSRCVWRKAHSAKNVSENLVREAA